jgi:small subunit ribosomal protein S17
MTGPSPKASAAPAKRGVRKTQQGRVTSNKMNKTLTVVVERLSRHPMYDKYIRRRTKLYAHDEKNEARIGDIVELMETRPLSKQKRWRLVRIVRRAEA